MGYTPNPYVAAGQAKFELDRQRRQREENARRESARSCGAIGWSKSRQEFAWSAGYSGVPLARQAVFDRLNASDTFIAAEGCDLYLAMVGADNGVCGSYGNSAIEAQEKALAAARKYDTIAQVWVSIHSRWGEI